MNTVSAFYFDTVVTITADASEALLREALSRCSHFNKLLSKTAEGSDVWELNHAVGQWVEVSGHTAQVVQAALEVGSASGGAFNIALAPLVALWNVRSASPRVPGEGEIALALERADFTRIEACGRRIRMPAGMMIDLGGIAKGYIADQVADWLRAAGVTSALLNFGGNVVTVGRKPDGSAWKVGLQMPDGEASEFFAVVESADSTVVTSGVYDRGFMLDGRRYHHILDPRTGRPVQNGIAGVSVVGTGSMLADAAATALLVLGREAGAGFAGRYCLETVYRMDGGSVSCSEGLPIAVVRR